MSELNDNKAKNLPLEITYDTTFISQHNDNEIYKRIRLVQFILLEVKKIKPSQLNIEEWQVGDNYLYRIENLRHNLVGYLGRDIAHKELNYLVMDNSQFKRAKLEGFYELENFTRESVFDILGVMIAVQTINDFILFLGAQKGWAFKGGYLKTGEVIKS